MKVTNQKILDLPTDTLLRMDNKFTKQSAYFEIHEK